MTSPRLFRLIAATVAHAEDHRQPCPSLRDFVRDFRGLSSTVKAKEIAEMVGASGETLAEFHRRGEGQAARAPRCNAPICRRPVPPRDLGVIGKEHLLNMAVAYDADGNVLPVPPSRLRA